MARVLILEDSPLILQMLTMVCESAGHQVHTCESFARATEVAVSDEPPPQVILSDLTLPDGPDGSLVAALQALPGWREVPVILISGRPQAELDRIAAETGAVGALSKDAGLPAISAALPGLIDGI